MRSASARRLTIFAARQRVDAARRLRAASGATPTPTLFLGATGRGDPTGGSEDLALVVPIDVFGKGAAARSSGDAGIAVATAQLRQTESELQGEVLLRFTDAVAAESLVVVALTQSEIGERLLDATRRRAEEGIIPGVQVQRAQIEADRSRRTLIRREAEASAAAIRLAAAIGIEGPVRVSPQAFPDLSAATASLGRPLRTPEVLVRSATLEGATADVRVARLLGQPELQIEARRAPFYESNNRIYPRLQLSLPLFGAGKARNERRAAEARRNSLAQELEDAQAQAQAAIRAAQLEFEAAGEEVASFDSTLTAARTLVERTEIGLKEGAITFTEALEATRTLRDVEEGLVEARRRLAFATSELLRSGGVLLAPFSEEAGS